MYAPILDIQFVDALQEKARQYIHTIAEPYLARLNAVIEKYVADNKLVVSNIRGLLGDDEPDLPYTPYQIYCLNPYKHAVALSNKIHMEVGKWVRMETKATHAEFVIQYNTREACRIYTLGHHGALRDISFINPVKTATRLLLPPEIEIIDVYHRLYLPNNAAEWDDLAKVESTLYDMVIRRAEQKFAGGRAGRDHRHRESRNDGPSRDDRRGNDRNGRRGDRDGQQDRNGSPARCDTPECKRRGSLDVTALQAILFQKFLRCSGAIPTSSSDGGQGTDAEYVLVGRHGTVLRNYAAYTSAADVRDLVDQPRAKLQIISQRTIEHDLERISTFLKRYTEYAIDYREHNMDIPKDFRVRRFTVRLHVPKEGSGVRYKPLIDIFHAGSYELVPYDVAKAKMPDGKVATYLVGTPHVLLRFAMIDLQVVRVMGEAEIVDRATRDRFMSDIISTITDIKKGASDRVPSLYYGVNVDIAFSRLIVSRHTRGMHDVYVPEQELRRGHYRVVGPTAAHS